MGRLTELAQEHHVLLSGSLLAVLKDDRAAAARYLAHRGHWVHADVIEGSFRGQPGLSLAELEPLAPVAKVLDIHLMVDDPVETIKNLPIIPRRLTVQLRNLASAPEILRLARALSCEIWIAVEELAPGDIDALKALDLDGVLVMLTPPGSAGHIADLDRLNSVRAANNADLSVGVDGGVNAENLPTTASAGIRYAVSGRAFFQELRQELPHVGSVTT
ncbi:Pentose-5-phosphate-3-epimerase [Arthrobacter sp. ov118]|nr:Pentose-5-phosphate-3-epimerase [Arthrobacter sp. ov118]